MTAQRDLVCGLCGSSPPPSDAPFRAPASFRAALWGDRVAIAPRHRSIRYLCRKCFGDVSHLEREPDQLRDPNAGDLVAWFRRAYPEEMGKGC